MCYWSKLKPKSDFPRSIMCSSWSSKSSNSTYSVLLRAKKWRPPLAAYLMFVLSTPQHVNFRPKRTKINPIFVRFGSYWMLISMVKIIFGHYLHKNGHRKHMMPLSCLKTSFLGSENQFFNTFEFFSRLQFFFNFFAELQIWQKLI